MSYLTDLFTDSWINNYADISSVKFPRSKEDFLLKEKISTKLKWVLMQEFISNPKLERVFRKLACAFASFDTRKYLIFLNDIKDKLEKWVELTEIESKIFDIITSDPIIVCIGNIEVETNIEPWLSKLERFCLWIDKLNIENRIFKTPYLWDNIKHLLSKIYDLESNKYYDSPNYVLNSFMKLLNGDSLKSSEIDCCISVTSILKSRLKNIDFNWSMNLYQFLKDLIYTQTHKDGIYNIQPTELVAMSPSLMERHSDIN